MGAFLAVFPDDVIGCRRMNIRDQSCQPIGNREIRSAFHPACICKYQPFCVLIFKRKGFIQPQEKSKLQQKNIKKPLCDSLCHANRPVRKKITASTVTLIIFTIIFPRMSHISDILGQIIIILSTLNKFFQQQGLFYKVPTEHAEDEIHLLQISLTPSKEPRQTWLARKKQAEPRPQTWGQIEWRVQNLGILS